MFVGFRHVSSELGSTRSVRTMWQYELRDLQPEQHAQPGSSQSTMPAWSPLAADVVGATKWRSEFGGRSCTSVALEDVKQPNRLARAI